MLPPDQTSAKEYLPQRFLFVKCMNLEKPTKLLYSKAAIRMCRFHFFIKKNYNKFIGL